ncbi:MAG: DUF4416 family protein [Candidatus Omnitrophica bacterium]|nr:DUF4416 family protein [Candidatus Omnitrophota bacterium]MBU1924792.1 DUF4416 family protein [Candidatus Omnitrophota bacterium]
MGVILKANSVKLIIGLIGKEEIFNRVKKILIQKFGGIDFENPVLDFNFTDYYELEMGGNLKRQFLSFKRQILPDKVASIKIYTNSLEKRFSAAGGRRRVNIDPGYLTLSKLVLATTKDYQHRIYLGKGIFAEVTLRFKDKSFREWEWTYPDYRSREYIDIFNYIRNNLCGKKERK